MLRFNAFYNILDALQWQVRIIWLYGCRSIWWATRTAASKNVCHKEKLMPSGKYQHSNILFKFHFTPKCLCISLWLTSKLSFHQIFSTAQNKVEMLCSTVITCSTNKIEFESFLPLVVLYLSLLSSLFSKLGGLISNYMLELRELCRH